MSAVALTVAQEQFLLSSNSDVMTRGRACPEGVVVFTCVGVNLISNGLRWYIDGDQISYYTATNNNSYPQAVVSSVPDVNVTIVSAQVGNGRLAFVNSTLTLTFAVTSFKPLQRIGCGSLRTQNSTSVGCTMNTSCKL